MKSLNFLTNSEKAGIIHTLLPSEVGGYLEFTQYMYKRLQDEKEQLCKKWDNDFISYDSWLEMAECINASIEKYSNAMKNKKPVFVCHLFESYGFLYSIHCLQQYSLSGKPTEQFKNLVAALFL